MVVNPLKTLSIVLVVAMLTACQTTPEPVQTPMRGPVSLARDDGRPVIAYALGSGAARGFAHVGVLNALDAAGIFPDIIVGTSSGGIVGALYASGIRGDELSRIALEIERDEVIDYTASRRGVITGKSLQTFVNQKLNHRLLQDLDVTVAIVATDLRSGQKAVFTHGDSGLAIRAASSFPGWFQPAVIDGREFVDGGVLSPVPVETALELGADLVIAVDVAKQPSSDAEIDGWIDVLHQSYLIMARELSETEVSQADIVIRPDIGDMSLLDFELRDKAIQAGETAAKDLIPLIRSTIEKKTMENAQ